MGYRKISKLCDQDDSEGINYISSDKLIYLVNIILYIHII